MFISKYAKVTDVKDNNLLSLESFFLCLNSPDKEKEKKSEKESRHKQGFIFGRPGLISYCRPDYGTTAKYSDAGRDEYGEWMQGTIDYFSKISKAIILQMPLPRPYTYNL